MKVLQCLSIYLSGMLVTASNTRWPSLLACAHLASTSRRLCMRCESATGAPRCECRVDLFGCVRRNQNTRSEGITKVLIRGSVGAKGKWARVSIKWVSLFLKPTFMVSFIPNLRVSASELVCVWHSSDCNVFANNLTSRCSQPHVKALLSCFCLHEIPIPDIYNLI